MSKMLLSGGSCSSQCSFFLVCPSLHRHSQLDALGLTTQSGYGFNLQRHDFNRNGLGCLAAPTRSSMINHPLKFS